MDHLKLCRQFEDPTRDLKKKVFYANFSVFKGQLYSVLSQNIDKKQFFAVPTQLVNWPTAIAGLGHGSDALIYIYIYFICTCMHSRSRSREPSPYLFIYLYRVYNNNNNNRRLVTLAEHTSDHGRQTNSSTEEKGEQV